MRAPIILVVVLVAVVSGMLVGPRLFSTQYGPGYTEAGFDRIKVGMTDREAYAILGVGNLSFRHIEKGTDWYVYSRFDNQTNSDRLSLSRNLRFQWRGDREGEANTTARAGVKTGRRPVNPQVGRPALPRRRLTTCDTAD